MLKFCLVLFILPKKLNLQKIYIYHLGSPLQNNPYIMK